MRQDLVGAKKNLLNCQGNERVARHLNIAGMTHEGDEIRHRYRPDSQKKWGERAANSGGYTSKSSDVWFYVAIIGFFVFLRFLPWILRKLGCIPPRPERVVLRRNPGEETTEELSEEERKELVTKSLSTTKVTKHSPDLFGRVCGETTHRYGETRSIADIAVFSQYRDSR